ncbi:PKD domain-containing protein, partial [Paenimyroides tangerinum]
MIKRLLLFFTMLLFWQNNYAQSFNMADGVTIETCSGVFYDSGGPTGDYQNAVQQIMTFCPDFPESAIQVAFLDLDLQNGNDILFVYDGPDINSPLLTTITGTEIPLAQVASGSNTSGCLTFRFISDAQITGRGWVAEVECVTPCQVIMAYLDYSSPSRDADGIIKACIGQEITLGAQATFSGNGAGSVYTWDFENGETATGQNVTVSYDTPGIYRVNVLVTDTFDCRNNNIINQVIQISPEPTVYIDLPPEICFGVDTVVTVEAEYERITRECAPPVTGTTFLPDGNNNIYSTSITIDCFENDEIITEGNQVAKVCINMEHSHSNDITIRLISPNGEIVRLHNRGGGGTYIGQANRDGTLEPGIGETYCFTMDAATILINGQTMPGGFNPPGNMWVPGDYKPVDSYNNFIGSPVNGVWTLQVHDQLAIDNGYIFGWSIEFSEDILPASFNFKPELESISVPLTNGVVDVTGNQFTINPEVAGELCYDVTIINDFGCEYTQTICTNVDPQIVLNQPRSFEGCADENGDFTFDFTPLYSDLSDNQFLVFSIYETEANANEAINALATTQTQNITDGIVTYWVRAYNVNSGCFRVVSFTAQAFDCLLNLVYLPDLSICQGQLNSFNLAQYTPVVYFNDLDHTVAYYNTEANAIAQTDPIDANLLANYVGTNNETIWVRVTNNFNSDVFGITSFKIFIYSAPEFYDLEPIYGCEIPGTGLANFNLSFVQNEASGSSPNIEVSFYPTFAEAEIGDVANRLPLNYTGFQGTIFVRAYNPNTGCFTIMSLLTNVVDAPGANQIAPLEICSFNNDGYGIFNLIPTTVMIAGNPIPPGVQVSYHETLADANNNVNKIPNIGVYQNIVPNIQTIYVRVGYQNSTCSAIVPLELIVKSTPIITTPTPLTACDSNNDGVADFDLTSKINEILNGLDPLRYIVTFYTNEDNANAGTNEITNPGSFSNLTSNVVFVRVQDNTAGCYKVTRLVLVTNPTPVIVNPIATYSLCDDNFDGFQVFDIASKIPLITGTQTGLQVTFHYTLADANSGSNPLASPYQNVVQNVQTLFIRVQRLSTGCFTTTTMDIRVSPVPVLNVPVTPFDICSDTDSSFGTVNLTSFNVQLLNGGPAHELKYFETQANAQNNVLPILNPQSYNNLQASNPSVWVRATNEVTGCFSVYKINFRILVSPKMPVTLPNIITCDVQDDLFDGITPIDLTQQTPLILAVQTIPGNYEVRYFTSLVLANVGTNWIANPQAYMNTTNPQTIWARVQNTAHPTTCF